MLESVYLYFWLATRCSEHPVHKTDSTCTLSSNQEFCVLNFLVYSVYIYTVESADNVDLFLYKQKVLLKIIYNVDIYP